MTEAGVAIERRTVHAALVGPVLTGAFVIVFASIGSPAGVSASAASVAWLLLVAGAPAAWYLLGAAGLGRALDPFVRGSRDPGALRAALGVALMLSLSHALGCLGLLAGRAGRAVAIALPTLGVALLAAGLVADARRERRIVIRASAVWWLAAPAVALLLVAACQPPGWLWDSEFGGFDALSYHLQLPQEWLALGRIVPLEHNVYSYLPGYIESAFLHLGVMTGAPAEATPSSRPVGFVAGDGTRLLSCQVLHAGLALLAAWIVGRAARAASGVCGADLRRANAAGALGGVLFIATPWMIVVGSLAYNEMGAVALGAGAMLAALDTNLPPARRAGVAGLLVGAACGCKATALLFVGPPVGILLLGLAPARRWLAMVAAGSAAGAVMLAPWLIRNAYFGGNPVFPYLTSLFGHAHWSPDQAERFRAATIIEEPILTRLRLLLFPDPTDPAGPRHRGMLHPQWGLFFPFLLAGAVAAAIPTSTRRVALLLSAGLASQLAAWLFASHIQSRFLIPLAIPGCMLMGLALAGPDGRRRLLRLVAGSAAIVIQLAGTVRVFAGQRGGQPGALLVLGPGALSGTIYRDPADAERFGPPSPEVFLNLSLPPGRRVYLLGDSTPLYYAVPVLYNTTWDCSPMADAIREHPGDPAAWSRRLRERRIDLVLVNLSELSRLSRSGFLDPALTPEAIAAWLPTTTRVRSWPGGRVLVSLEPTGGSVP